MPSQRLAPHHPPRPAPTAVCLRALAAADPACRAAAYQALALFEEQLTAAAAPDFREKQQLRCDSCSARSGRLSRANAAALPSVLSPCPRTCAGLGGGRADEGANQLMFPAVFRCSPCPPCSVLLSTLRATITRPFQRLPAVHAVFLAEAGLCTQLLQGTGCCLRLGSSQCNEAGVVPHLRPWCAQQPLFA